MKAPLKTILALSAAISLFLFWFVYIKEPMVSVNPIYAKLPLVNCLFNGLSAIALCFGFSYIKKGEKEKHIKAMGAAVLFSALFLVSYLIYHNTTGHTVFLGQGFIRPVYFFTLISHIGLTVVALPFILLTLFYALTSQFEGHKKVARFTFPMWLYNSVTGVLIYVLNVLFN